MRRRYERILNPPIELGGRKSPANAILIDGAGELGLVYYNGQEGGYNIYDLCAPDVKDTRLRNSRAVWDILDRQLRDTSISLSSVVDMLKAPPFGLSTSVLQLFLAAFLSLNRDYITIHSATNASEPPIGVNGEKIAKIVEASKEYVILYKPLSSKQAEFLRGLIDILVPNLGSRRIEVGSLLDQVATLFSNKIKDTPIISQQPSINDLAGVLSDSSQDTLKICQRLIEIGHLSHELLKIGLLETLPQTLSLPKDSTVWTNESLAHALSDCSSAYKQLQQISTNLRRSLMQQIGQMFEADELPNSEKDALEAAKKWRIEKVKIVQLENLAGSSDAQELVKVLDDSPHSFEQAFLNTLPFRWKLQIFEQWQAISTKKMYLDRLILAKQVVEETVLLLAPTPSNETANVQSTTQTVALSKSSSILPTQSAISEPEASFQESLPRISTIKSEPARTIQSNDSLRALPVTNDERKQTKVATNIDFPNSAQVEKTLVAEQPVNIPLPQKVTNDAANQAFETIKAIFEGLLPSQQRKLWNLLVEEYDPR